MNIVVLALYKFVALESLQTLKASLLSLCEAKGIKGTLLLAHEGINGTVSGSREAIDTLKHWFDQDKCFQEIDFKESVTETHPFNRMKVKLKKEIVTLGVPSIDPTKLVGKYVQPCDWNALLQDPDMVVLDTRNEYEYGLGTFEGAINPHTESFKEFDAFVDNTLDPQKHTKVAMFCTGGIRCEKASSLLLAKGFKEVYHLKGGILKYLEEIPEKESLWQGDCFVFDHRVAVNHALAPSEYDMCHACRHPVSPEDRLSPTYIEHISCPHCAAFQTPRNKTRATDRAKQMHKE